MQLDTQQIHSIVEKYLTIFPEEREHLAPLFQFLDTTEWDLYDRKNMDGHIVGSGIIVDPRKDQTLMIYHNTFQRYQQPGGHIDPGETPLQWTQRECIEETGIQNFTHLAVDRNNEHIPLDIGCHMIATNEKKNESEHRHFNFIYAFVTNEKTPIMDDDGVSDAKWFALDEIMNVLPNIPQKIRLFT